MSDCKVAATEAGGNVAPPPTCPVCDGKAAVDAAALLPRMDATCVDCGWHFSTGPRTARELEIIAYGRRARERRDAMKIHVPDWSALKCSARCPEPVVVVFTPKQAPLDLMVCACAVHEGTVEAGALAMWAVGVNATKRKRSS